MSWCVHATCCKLAWVHVNMHLHVCQQLATSWCVIEREKVCECVSNLLHVGVSLFCVCLHVVCQQLATSCVCVSATCHELVGVFLQLAASCVSKYTCVCVSTTCHELVWLCVCSCVTNSLQVGGVSVCMCGVPATHHELVWVSVWVKEPVANPSAANPCSFSRFPYNDWLKSIDAQAKLQVHPYSL